MKSTETLSLSIVLGDLTLADAISHGVVR